MGLNLPFVLSPISVVEGIEFASKYASNVAPGVWWMAFCIAAICCAVGIGQLETTKFDVFTSALPKKIGVFFILFAFFAQLFILGDTGTLPFAASFLSFAGFMCLWFPPRNTDEPVSDLLHREYFAERIFRLIKARCSSEHSGARIAVVGQWGSGKTYLLRLLAQKLRADEKMRIAWVNPWRSATKAEAWQSFANGISTAIGRGEIATEVDGLFGKVLRSLLPSKAGNIANAVIGSIQDKGKLTPDILGQFERSLFGRTVTILVDDMERAEPATVRSLFPLIDRLSELPNCFFVFAIDPDRLLRAFNDTEKGSEEAKGYLSKVVDYQISLPSPTDNEISRLAGLLVDEHEFPKLSVALSALDKVLPKNPRELIRYVEACRSAEWLWLWRYRDDEAAFAPLFLLMLMDIEFPGSSERVQELSGRIGNMAVMRAFGRATGEDADDSEFNELRDMFEEPASQSDRFSLLLQKLLHFLTNDFQVTSEEWEFDIDWLASNHKKLLFLSKSECESACEAFRNRESEVRVHEILRCALPDNVFSETDECVQQFLVHEVSTIRGIITDFDRNPENVHPDQIRLCETISSSLLRHMGAINDGTLPNDRKFFSGRILAELNRLLVRAPVGHLCNELFQTTRTNLESLHEQVARSSAFEDVERENGWALQRDLEEREACPDRDYALDRLKKIEVQLEAVRFEHMRSVLQVRGFLHNLDVHWTDRIGDDLFVRNPYEWLGFSERSKGRVTTIVELASASEVVRSNLQMVLRYFVLRYLVDRPERNGFVIGQLKRLLAEVPWYLEGLWKGAIGERPSGEEAERLVRMVDRAVSLAEKNKPVLDDSPGIGYMPKEEIESVFPKYWPDSPESPAVEE